jgi:tripartite motif-containing protein 71
VALVFASVSLGFGASVASAAPPPPFNACSSQNLPAAVANADADTIIADGQMTGAGQEANYSATNTNGGLANSNTTVAFRSVLQPIPLTGLNGFSGSAYGSWGAFSYAGETSHGQWPTGASSLASVAGNSQLQYWQTNGYKFYYTVASSDFATGGEPLFVGECAGDGALRMTNDLGVYLHEVVSDLAAGNGYNWTAAVNAITPTEWQDLDYWVQLAKFLNKKVIWSEPAQAWQALAQNATANDYFAQWGDTLVPMFATNFESPGSGHLMGMARDWAAVVAQAYGMPLGESVQSWYFRQQTDLAGQATVGLPTAGATLSGSQSSEQRPPCCELDPLNTNAYENGSYYYGDPLNSTLTGLEPSLSPTANATQALAQYGGSAGATYFQLEGTNGTYEVADSTTPEAAVDDMGWPSAGLSNASTFLQGVEQFSSQQLASGPMATSAIPTEPLYQLWNPTLISHYYTTQTNSSGDPLDPYGNASPDCNNNPSNTVYCYQETPASETAIPTGYIGTGASVSGEVALYEYTNGAEGFYYTTNQSSHPSGYSLVGTVGYVMSSQQPGTEPWFWMYEPGYNGHVDYFYTTDPDYERPNALDSFYNYQDLGVNSWLFTAPTVTPVTGPVGPTQSGEMTGGYNPSEADPRGCGGDVDCQTGELDESSTDFSTPGRGPGIVLARSYASLATPPTGTPAPFGPGWTDSYNMWIEADPNTQQYPNTEDVVQEDGSIVRFTDVGGTWTPPGRVLATLVQNGNGTWTFTRQKTQIFTFSSGGQLSTVSDLDGDTTTLAYNGSGKLSTITDPAGRTLTFNYITSGNGTGDVGSVTQNDSAARTVTYTYNANGMLATAKDVNANTTSYGYNGTSHYITSITEPNGGITSYAYDSSNRVTTETVCTVTGTGCPTADQRTTSYAYNISAAGSGTTVITDPLGIETQQTFLNGDLVSEVDAYATNQPAYSTYTYEPTTNELASQTNADNETTSYTYDANGNTISKTTCTSTALPCPSGDSQTTTWTYNAYDEITSMTPPATYGANTATTTYNYDQSGYSSGGAGNLTSMSTPILSSTGTNEGTQTTYYYHSNSSHPGDVTSMVDPNGKTWTYTYDSYGDKISQTAPATSDNSDGSGSRQNVTKWAYNADGFRVATLSGRYTLANPSATTCPTPTTSSPEPGCTTYTYNNAGQLLSTTDPNGHVTSATYDGDGNVHTKTDANNNTTTYGYDAADEQTSETRADNSVLHTDYNADGEITDQIDASNDDTHTTYDNLGNVSSITDPDGHVTGYQYDALGNLLVKSDPGVSGCTTTSTTDGCTIYTYNAVNEQTAVNYNDTHTHNVTVAYDANGRRTSMTDASGTSTWTYDSLGRVTATTNGAGATTSYGYDPESNVTSIAYPGSTGTVTRTFDPTGRISSITDWQGNTTNFAYDADSDLGTVTAPIVSKAIYSSSFGWAGSGNNQMSGPSGAGFDLGGTFWVADSYNNNIQQYGANGQFYNTYGSLGSGNGQLNDPTGLAINAAAQHVYVADSGNNRIEEFTGAGVFVATFGSQGSGNGQLSGPNELAIDPSGNVWVADTGNNRIEEFSATGTFIQTIGTLGAGNGQLNAPRGVVVVGGDVYVADGGNNRIEEFTTSGTYVTQFGGTGTGNGQFNNPTNIALDPATDDLYVTDTGNNRIQAFTLGGTFLQAFGTNGSGNGQFNVPKGIAFTTTGTPYVVDSANNRIEIWNLPVPAQSWAAGTSFGSSGPGNGQLSAPSGDTFDGTGNFWVADSNNNRIQQFSSTGTFYNAYGSLGSGNGQLNKPVGIAINTGAHDIYVADSGNNRIEEFTTAGAFVATFGSQGSGNGQLSNPTGVALDGSGNVWVADTGNNRIEEFSSTGTFIQTIGTSGSGNGQLSAPHGVVVVGGDVYVADSANNRIEEFTTSGTYVTQFGSNGSSYGQFNDPTNIAVDPVNNDLYVSDTGNNRVQAFTTGGSFITAFGKSGSGNGQFSAPQGIAFTTTGTPYIVDSTNNRIIPWTAQATPSSVTDTYTYDPADNISQVATTEGSTTLTSFAYTRDNANLVTGVTSTGVPTDNHTYGYNTLNQLSSSDSQNYGYNPANDLTGQPGGITENYDAAGELTSVSDSAGNTTFAYNTKGQRTSGGMPGQPTGTYTYNQAGELASATIGTGPQYTYTYNGDGLRVTKTVNSTNENYTWDSATGSVPLLLQDGSTSYVYGPGGLPLEQEGSTGTPLWYHHDQLGSTRLLTNIGGTTAGTATYGPYGQTTATTGTTSVLGYAGQYTDPETGLIYLRARYYDPTTGQFLTIDPADAVTLSAYGYTENDPINGADPTGEVLVSAAGAEKAARLLRGFVDGLDPIAAVLRVFPGHSAKITGEAVEQVKNWADVASDRLHSAADTAGEDGWVDITPKGFKSVTSVEYDQIQTRLDGELESGESPKGQLEEDVADSVGEGAEDESFLGWAVDEVLDHPFDFGAD